MPSSDPPTSAQVANAEPDAPQSQNQGKTVSANSTKPQEAGPKSDASKLSGAELKKQAKAEKAARRAQALQEKHAGSTATTSAVVASGSGSKPEAQKGVKAQQKKSGSTPTDARSLPIRGGAQKVAPVLDVPREEDKTVEFFRHLYRNRTTSISAAGKEVHPAVLALGLQMSSYTICGSCARLVATLQAFKRVSLPIRLD